MIFIYVNVGKVAETIFTNKKFVGIGRNNFLRIRRIIPHIHDPFAKDCSLNIFDFGSLKTKS